MNKKTFIMALCMVGHSGYAAPKRKEKEKEKKGKALAKQENAQQQQYSQQQQCHQQQRQSQPQSLTLALPQQQNWRQLLTFTPPQHQYSQQQQYHQQQRQSQPQPLTFALPPQCHQQQRQSQPQSLTFALPQQPYQQYPQPPQPNPFTTPQQQYPQQQNWQQHQQSLNPFTPPQQQYKKGAYDVILHVKAYQTMVNQLEGWSKKLPPLTNKMEVWNANLEGGDEKERQKLLEHVTQQNQEVCQVMNKFKEAQRNYQGSLKYLKNNFKGYFECDPDLQNVVNDFNQENTRIAAYTVQARKIREVYTAFKKSAKTTSPEEKQ